MTDRAPDPTTVVLCCMSCHHWQVDVHPRAVSELGGRKAALMAVASLAASEHGETECPGAGERVKYLGRWVTKPDMSDGTKPTGMMAAYPLPRWWVWR